LSFFKKKEQLVFGAYQKLKDILAQESAEGRYTGKVAIISNEERYLDPEHLDLEETDEDE
jgi:hypothetical protein